MLMKTENIWDIFGVILESVISTEAHLNTHTREHRGKNIAKQAYAPAKKRFAV